METEQQRLVKDVMRLVSEDASRSAILSSARQAKISLSKVWSEYQQALNMIDILVATYAPDPDWVAGWWSPTVAAQQLAPATRPVIARPPDRTRTVLAIASSLITRGQKRITVKAIMEQLRAQGDQRLAKAMAISVGNILAWSKQWKKVAPGEYEPKEEKEEQAKLLRT